jgi:hypothetical protein
MVITSLLLISGIVGATYSFTNETTSVGGRVTNSDGKPISGALILARSSSGTEFAISDDSGFYVLNNIPLFENIKISCLKEHYNTFRTSVYIDIVGICLLLDIELQKITTNFIKNSMDFYNL